ncbi:lecithin-cholesterol acyltransferase-like 1 [Panicum virgatum]|nr:lecithin-cholesterol acyltransferase-like 1 [Panicum virgatum]
MWRTFETAIVNLPSPEVFGRRPLLVTRSKNYSAYDIADLLVAISSANGDKPFRERELAKMGYFKAPMVPMTHMYGMGVPTEEQLVYREGDFDIPPEMVYGDGDGTINLKNMLAFEEKVGKQPGQRELFKSIRVTKVPHSELVIHQRALKKIMCEIVELNR